MGPGCARSSSPVLAAGLALLAGLCGLAHAAPQHAAPAGRPRLVVHSGPTSGEFQVYFGPDPRLLLSTAHDQIARVWDVATGRELRRLEGSARAPLIVSPDGATVTGGSDEAGIRFWDFASGRLLRTVGKEAGEAGPVGFSPDSRFLYAHGRDGIVRRYPVAGGPAAEVLPRAFAGQVGMVALAPYGRRLAFEIPDQRLVLWDLEARRVEWAASLGLARGFEFVPGTDLILVDGLTWIAYLEASTGREVASRHIYYSSFQGLSPDGRFVATFDEQGTGLRSVRDWKLVRRLHGEPREPRGPAPPALEELEDYGMPEPASVAFTTDGELLAAGAEYYGISLSETRSGRHLRTLRCEWRRPVGASLSPDDAEMVLILGSESGARTLARWDLRRGTLRALPPALGREAYGVRHSPDGRHLAIGYEDGSLSVLDLRRWDRGDPQALLRLRRPDGPEPRSRTAVAPWHQHTLRFDPTGRLLASGYPGVATETWDLKTHCPVQVIPYRSLAMLVGFTGSRGLVLSFGKHIEVWGPDHRSPPRRFAIPACQGEAAQLCGPGDRLLVGSNQGQVSLWDLRTGRRLRTVGSRPGAIYRVTPSADGRRVAVAYEREGLVEVWSLSDGRRLFANSDSMVLPGGQLLNRNGSRLASFTLEGGLRWWSVSEGGPREAGTLWSFRDGGWVAVQGDRYYDGTPSGLARLHWVQGNRVLLSPPRGHGARRPGILRAIAGW